MKQLHYTQNDFQAFFIGAMLIAGVLIMGRFGW